EVLHGAILERVKTDDGEPSVRRQTIERRFEPRLQLLELAIDVDAQRLEHAGRRMFVAGAAGRVAARDAGDALDQTGELQSALERPCTTVGDDGARNALRLPFLAVFPKDA